MVRCRAGYAGLDPRLLDVPGIVSEARRRHVLVLFPEARRSVWVPRSFVGPSEPGDPERFPLTARVAAAALRWGGRGFEIEAAEDGGLLLQLETEGMEVEDFLGVQGFFGEDGAKVRVLPAGMHRLRIEVRYPAR